MRLPDSEELEIHYLNRIFDNTSECYKYFWFQAVLNKVLEGKEIITFEEMINEMIADAWYMVSEYHLNLGPRDTLERLIRRLCEISDMKSCEKKDVILEYLENCTDREVMQKKRVLSYHVPYRLQAPFLENVKGNAWNVLESQLIRIINRKERLMYYFTVLKGMQTAICIQPEWAAYMKKNQEILKGWLQYKMILYLEENISIDHFVPWSFVAHDEFWNLHPTTRVINSYKSNYLPDWECYFPRLCRLEYFSYEMIQESQAVREAFEICAREHLNSSMIRGRVYKYGQSLEEFSRALEEVVRPVYQSAMNCGFQKWPMERAGS